MKSFKSFVKKESSSSENSQAETLHKRKKKQKKQKKEHKQRKLEAKNLGSLFLLDTKGSTKDFVPPTYSQFCKPLLFNINHQKKDKNPHDKNIFYTKLKDNLAKKSINLSSILSSNTADLHSESFISISIDDNHIDDNEINKPISNDELFTQKVKEFSVKLNSFPTNVQLWLDYIQLQDSLLKIGSTRKLLKPALQLRKAVNEKKVAIYEKALVACPLSQLLWSGYIDCLETVLTKRDLLRKWDEILESMPNSILLHMKYADFRKTQYESASVSSCLDVYSDSISNISKMKVDSAESNLKYRSIVNLIAKACYLMMESGYIERAIATFQAIIEFNFYLPPAFESHNFEQQVSNFQTFWDSEVPRFGEKDSLGWKNGFLKEISPFYVVEPNITNQIDENDQEVSSKYVLWGKQEVFDEYYKWSPQRSESADAQDVGDPFRCILFDDIKLFLVSIPTSRGKSYLINVFINFLCGGVYKESECDDDSGCFFQEGFGWSILKERDPEKYPLKPFTSISNEPFKYPFPFRDQKFDLEMRFLNLNSPFQCHTNSDSKFIGNLGFQWMEFLKRVLSQSSQIEDNLEYHTLTLAIETSLNPKSARKTAKKLLKTYPKSLLLWNTFALIEQAGGNIDEARNVYLVTLSATEFSRSGVELIYFSFAQFEILNNRLDDAAQIFASFADKIPFVKSQNTKSTKMNMNRVEGVLLAYDRMIMEASEELNNFSIVALISAQALFEYISNGFKGAFERFENGFLLVTGKENRQLLFQKFISFLCLHQEKSFDSAGFNTNEIREGLMKALKEFPKNTYFLNALSWSERKTKIENRVGVLLEDLSKNSPQNDLSWILFYVWHSLQSLHQINESFFRSIFERGLEESSKSRYLPVFWFCYIQFELKQNNLGNAKALFFRAIGSCPWSKDLYMFGFIELYDIFDPEEIEELIVLMNEKEIRIRNNIE